MSAPSIFVTSNQSMNTVMGTEGTFVKYELFADSSSFDNWKDWVEDPVNKPSATEKDNASKYSSYVLKFYCQLKA